MPIKVENLTAGGADAALRATVGELKDGEALTLAEVVEQTGMSSSAISRAARRKGLSFLAYCDGRHQTFIANLKTAEQWRKQNG